MDWWEVLNQKQRYAGGEKDRIAHAELKEDSVPNTNTFQWSEIRSEANDSYKHSYKAKNFTTSHIHSIRKKAILKEGEKIVVKYCIMYR